MDFLVFHVRHLDLTTILFSLGVSFIHSGFSINDLFKRMYLLSLPKMVKFGLATKQRQNCCVPNRQDTLVVGLVGKPND